MTCLFMLMACGKAGLDEVVPSKQQGPVGHEGKLASASSRRAVRKRQAQAEPRKQNSNGSNINENTKTLQAIK